MNWGQVLDIMTRAIAEQGDDERRVLLVLADGAHHIKEVLSREAPGDRELLAFVVHRDDPNLSKRTDETSLLFTRPEQVLRVHIHGYDTTADQTLGF